MSKRFMDVDMVCIATQSNMLYFLNDFRHKKDDKFMIFFCAQKFFPVNLGGDHWVLAQADLYVKRVWTCDSLVTFHDDKTHLR